MTDGKPLVALGGRGAVLGDEVLEPVFRRLNLLGLVLVVVVGVDVEVGDVVAEISHVLLAARVFGARRVRWAEVRWDLAEDIANGHFVHDDLVDAILSGNLAQVEMRPSVRCDLVTLRVHALDDLVVFNVNLALVNVVASDKESSFRAVALEQVQNVLGELLLRTVVESKCDHTRLCALKDSGTTVGDVSNLVTGD